LRTSRGHGGTALADQPMTQVDAKLFAGVLAEIELDVIFRRLLV
jgi:hypothetical protein